jgi:hypothetical protein
VNFLLGLVGGVLLGLAELSLRAHLPASPDLTAAGLALLMLRADAAGPRRTGSRCAGLLLGGSTCSLDPVGAALLGGAIAALLLLSLRRMVFAESVATQAVFGATAALALALGRALHAWVGLAPALPFAATSWTTPLLTAAAVPILAQAGGALLRMARRSAARTDAGTGDSGGAASG